MYKYSLEQLRVLAEECASRIESPYTVLLEGDLGSGKTTFAKFFISKLLGDKFQNVTSPTFNIVQIYETIKGNVWHADLYRIKTEEELFELGIIEAMHECICLIEWPQILRKYTRNCPCMLIDLS